MKQVLEHIEKVAKEVKLNILYEDDFKEQNPKLTPKLVLVEIGSFRTKQEDRTFEDDIPVFMTITNESGKKALEMIHLIRHIATIIKTDGIKKVTAVGVSTGENSYIETMKTYKIEFEIKTLTER